MAYDPGQAQILRNTLAGIDGITEKKMFGGLCFLLGGHMLCGVHAKGGMARVGKEQEADALTIDGTAPLSFTGRPMGGFVDMSDDLIVDETRRTRLVDLSLAFVRTLPPK